MPDRADHSGRRIDLPVWGAISLLVVVLAWKVALQSTAPPSLRAHELLAPASAAASNPDSGRLVLIVAGDDRAGEPDLIRRARSAHPGRTLDIERVPWQARGDPRSRQGRIAALVRGYGHTELPVLLTVSREGQVVRVQSLASGADRASASPVKRQ